MTRFFTAILAVAVALFFVGVAIAPAAGAVQDETPDATDGDADSLEDGSNETENETDIISQYADHGDYLTEVDNETRVTGWQYDGERFEIEFEADESTTVVLTEAVQFDEGVGTGSIREYDIPPGNSTVSINVDPVGGEAAVTITTQLSTDEGRFTYVSTGQTDTSAWFDGGATWGLVYTGSVATFVGVAIGVRHYKRKQDLDDDDYRVEDL